MKAWLKWAVTPYGWGKHGPWHHNDWRARLRRLLGVLPGALHHELWRLELAIRWRTRLREIPRVGLIEHRAWITVRDIEWAEVKARELGWATEGKAGEDR